MKCFVLRVFTKKQCAVFENLRAEMFYKKGVFAMATRVQPKKLLTACQMSFEGKRNKEIAEVLRVSEATISRWRKHDLWIEFELELIAAQKQQALQVS